MQHYTTVVNVKVAHIRPKYDNLKDWCENKRNLYIGRKGIVFIDNVRYPSYDSPWANPFKISDEFNRDQVIIKYRKYILVKLRSGELDIADIYGKRLGCWCKPDACHGDVLIEILEYYLIHDTYPT